MQFGAKFCAVFKVHLLKKFDILLRKFGQFHCGQIRGFVLEKYGRTHTLVPHIVFGLGDFNPQAPLPTFMSPERL